MGRAHAMHNASAAKVWLNCGQYFVHKQHAEAAGEEEDNSNPASLRGTILHDVVEAALTEWMEDKGQQLNSDYVEIGWGTVENSGRYEESSEMGDAMEKISEEDLEQVERALDMAIDLINSGPDPQIMMEAEVELSHEPGSKGYIDLGVVFSDGNVVVADYKFGVRRVAPDGPQNKIYAGNLLKKIWNKLRVKPDAVRLAIIQPHAGNEPFVRRVSMIEIARFMGFVEQTVLNQLDGTDKRFASSLSTCNEFCPFTERCGGHQLLVAQQLEVLNIENASDGDMEELVANRSLLKKSIDAWASLVSGDEDRFPNWRRSYINNARKWVNGEMVSVEEIAHQLRLEGVEDPYVLATPAALLKQYPACSDAIEEYSTDQGSHVRLGKRQAAEDVPRETPNIPPLFSGLKKEEDTKPKTKKAAAKAAAKKPAKKRAVKKKAAKKKARKTT